MKIRHSLPIIFVLVVLGALVAYFPPGLNSWHRFFADSAPLSRKVIYLSRAYAVPAALSFCAVVFFQVQMRMSVGGAPVSLLFPLSVLGATSMLGAFRTMVGGIGGVPGYAVGMATAYTVMSRLYAVRLSRRTIFGQPTVKILWRGGQEAMREMQVIAARRQLMANSLEKADAA